MNGKITEAMEDNAKLIESLLERAVEYGKTSLELVKLKALDKTSDVSIYSNTSHSYLCLNCIFYTLFQFGISLLARHYPW